MARTKQTARQTKSETKVEDKSETEVKPEAEPESDVVALIDEFLDAWCEQIFHHTAFPLPGFLKCLGLDSKVRNRIVIFRFGSPVVMFRFLNRMLNRLNKSRFMRPKPLQRYLMMNDVKVRAVPNTSADTDSSCRFHFVVCIKDARVDRRVIEHPMPSRGFVDFSRGVARLVELAKERAPDSYTTQILVGVFHDAKQVACGKPPQRDVYRFCAKLLMSQFQACDGCGSREISHKRCSACTMAYYCDRECQRKHWKQGGHKHACVIMQAGVELCSFLVNRCSMLCLKPV